MFCLFINSFTNAGGRVTSLFSSSMAGWPEITPGSFWHFFVLPEVWLRAANAAPLPGEGQPAVFLFCGTEAAGRGSFFVAVDSSVGEVAAAAGEEAFPAAAPAAVFWLFAGFSLRPGGWIKSAGCFRMPLSLLRICFGGAVHFRGCTRRRPSLKKWCFYQRLPGTGRLHRQIFPANRPHFRRCIARCRYWQTGKPFPTSHNRRCRNTGHPVAMTGVVLAGKPPISSKPMLPSIFSDIKSY